jgi:beta-lactamase regulating signal transducer with metallopeptidase domain
MPVTALNAFAQSSAERLVNSAVEGVVLALLAWLILQLAPRQNAGTRFSIWMATLLSIATLPFAETLARADRPATASLSHASLTLPATLGFALFAAWALVATFLLVRLAFGVVQLFRLRASGKEVDLRSLPELSRHTLVEFQQHRQVSLCVSDRVSVPTALGLFRPAVVLPPWILSELSSDDLNAVLVHELAHLRRRDDWTNLLQKLVRAVFFFHPAVWWIESRLSLEREMACDEHVLANTEDPRAYAECLVSLAEKGFLHRAVMLAQGAVHRVKECSARVRQILASGRPRTAGASRLALVSAASGSVLLMATFAQAPNLIAFSSPGTRDVIATARPHTQEPAVAPAAWRPASQEMTPIVTPAVYVEHSSTVKQLKKSAASENGPLTAVNSAASQHATRSNSAPKIYRAGFTTPKPNAVPATFVIVKQTDFYSDGANVWAVSIYRMTVLRPQPSTPNDISRKAI